MLAQYGLGQMQIHKGKNDKAISCFERVLEVEPDNYGAMKILASLYSRTNSQTQQEKAQKLFRKVRVGVRHNGTASLEHLDLHAVSLALSPETSARSFKSHATLHCTLAQVTATRPEDIEAWIELAALLQAKAPEASVSYLPRPRFHRGPVLDQFPVIHGVSFSLAGSPYRVSGRTAED